MAMDAPAAQDRDTIQSLLQATVDSIDENLRDIDRGAQPDLSNTARLVYLVAKAIPDDSRCDSRLKADSKRIPEWRSPDSPVKAAQARFLKHRPEIIAALVFDGTPVENADNSCDAIIKVLQDWRELIGESGLADLSPRRTAEFLKSIFGDGIFEGETQTDYQNLLKAITVADASFDRDACVGVGLFTLAPGLDCVVIERILAHGLPEDSRHLDGLKGYVRRLLDVIKVTDTECPKPSRRQRNRKPPRDPIPLTARQLEVYRLYGEYKGNMTLVAQSMGIRRQTAKEHYDAANKKMGKHPPKTFKTRKLSPDEAGMGVPMPRKSDRV